MHLRDVLQCWTACFPFQFFNCSPNSLGLMGFLRPSWKEFVLVLVSRKSGGFSRSEARKKYEWVSNGRLFSKKHWFYKHFRFEKNSSESAMAETLPFKTHSRDFFKRLQRPYFGSGTLLRSRSGRSLGYRLVSLEWQDLQLDSNSSACSKIPYVILCYAMIW